jgi:archaeosortase C (PEF-CTERM variant)
MTINKQALGLFLFLAVLIYNFFTGDANIGTNDSVTLFFALSLISYDKFKSFEPHYNNFILYFSFYLFIIINSIFVIQKLYILFFGGSDEFSNLLIEYSLTKPLVLLLTIVSNIDIYDLNDHIVFFSESGERYELSIAKGCSGIYSIIIFSSAILSFFSINNFKDKLFIFNMLFFSIFLLYIANLLRMSIIVMVGFFYGMDYLLWTHANLGWLIFTFIAFIFFNFILTFINVRES